MQLLVELKRARQNGKMILCLERRGRGRCDDAIAADPVDEPAGSELDRLREVYFAAYPDGRERLSGPGLTHFRIVPAWGRFSDFAASPEPLILELDLAPG